MIHYFNNILLLNKYLLYYNINGDNMSEFLAPLISKAIELLQQYGFLAGCFMVVLESMIPILPLGLFVAFNFSAYGIFWGFLISYLSTVLGCIIAYFLSFRLLGVYVRKKSKDYDKLKKITTKFKKIKFANLVLVIALPFSPAFLINIASGTVDMNFKKFLFALLIGKLSIIYFWGMVGKSFIDSIGDIKTVLLILLSLVVSYLLSKIISKKMSLE